MKNFLLITGSILLVFVLVECEKDSATPVDKIAFVKTELGGCNGELFENLKSTNEDQSDTVSFSFRNDTLDIFVGMNYICCAPFDTEARISGDSIIMTINDTCNFPDQNCYCRCDCYYTWDFLLVDFSEKEYIFQIILDDPRQEKPIIFKEGTLTISINN